MAILGVQEMTRAWQPSRGAKTSPQMKAGSFPSASCVSIRRSNAKDADMQMGRAAPTLKRLAAEPSKAKSAYRFICTRIRICISRTSRRQSFAAEPYLPLWAHSDSKAHGITVDLH